MSKSNSIYINIHRTMLCSNKFRLGLLTNQRPKSHCAIEHLNTSEWFLSLAVRVGFAPSERFALTNVFDLTVLLTFHSLSDFNSCSNWEDKILVAQCSEPNSVNFHKGLKQGKIENYRNLSLCEKGYLYT